MSRPTVVDHAVDRLSKLGITDCFRMQKAEAADAASYIEIVAGKHDYPEGLKLVRTRLPEMYGV